MRLQEVGSEIRKAYESRSRRCRRDVAGSYCRTGTERTIHTPIGRRRIETSDVEIYSEDIPGWLVANEGKLTVALEVTITEELRREGIARELVNRIQNIRKSNGFEITDKIHIMLSKNPNTDDAVKEYNTYICNQVLANSLELTNEVPGGVELNFDDFILYVKVSKL